MNSVFDTTVRVDDNWVKSRLAKLGKGGSRHSWSERRFWLNDIPIEKSYAHMFRIGEKQFANIGELFEEILKVNGVLKEHYEYECRELGQSSDDITLMVRTNDGWIIS